MKLPRSTLIPCRNQIAPKTTLSQGAADLEPGKKAACPLDQRGGTCAAAGRIACMLNRRERRCPNCGAFGPMRFGYCEKCRIISPGPPIKFAPTRRRWLEQVLLYLGALYSPMKDAFFGLRNRISSRETPLRVVEIQASITAGSSVSASMSPFHATVVHELIPGPNAPGGQHHGQV